MVLYGLDGCRNNAWVVAESDPDFRAVVFRVVTDPTPLLRPCADGEAVAVLDVPIGLSQAPRACDVEARRLLRHRAVCVFTPPCREALVAPTYDDAKELSRRLCGAAISLQAFHLRDRIRAVDQLVTPDLQERVKEGHPEVAFAVLNGRRPLCHAKHTDAGIVERLALLVAAGMPAFEPKIERARLGLARAALDDIVDAAAMLVTAHHVAAGTADRLPAVGDERDARGLLLQIWMPQSASGRRRPVAERRPGARRRPRPR